MTLAVVFAFLAALGFSSGYVLIRVGTQRVSAPTATFLGVFTGAVLVTGLAFALNFQDIKALEPIAAPVRFDGSDGLSGGQGAQQYRHHHGWCLQGRSDVFATTVVRVGPGNQFVG